MNNPARDQPDNIVIVQSSFFPDTTSVAQLLTDLVSRLQQAVGVQTTVLCDSSPHVVPATAVPAGIRSVDIRRLRLPHRPRWILGRRPIRYAAYILWVWGSLLVGYRGSTVVSMTTPPLVAFAVAMALQFRRNRMVYYVEDLYPELFHDLGYVSSPWLVRKLSSMSRIVLRRAQAVIVIGEYMAARIRSVYGVDNRKLHVVPNWSHDTGFLGAPPAVVTARSERSFTILYSGNAGLAHDFTGLGPLVKRLREIPGIRYRFVGGGERFSSVQRMFRNLGEKRVTFAGFTARSAVAETLAMSDLLLIAQDPNTLGDIVPSKVYTYLAAGRPMLFLGPVRSEIGNLILAHDVGYVLSSSYDAQGAAEYIDHLRTNPAYLQAASDRARRLFCERFSLDHAYERLERVLLEEATA